jgi:antitoxin component YwqK of YwqJK toxin-antitoxin module
LNRKVYLLGFISFFGSSLFAQPGDNLANQIPKVEKYDESIVDPTYGIRIYEPLNYQLAGDSVRYCAGYACQSWVEDHYASGQLLHKGYYIDGQVKVYKNYYPNGKLEREFKNIDTFKTLAKLYYSNGNQKSEVKYQEGEPVSWTDFFDNGQVEYSEEYHKSFTYHNYKRSYFKDGKPESLFEIENKKKMEFSKKEYYANGNLKIDGFLKFDDSTYDYFKDGKWSYYDESGKLTKEEFYDKGGKQKEKTY